MKLSNQIKFFFTCFTIIIFFSKAYSQESKVVLLQDPRFEKLLVDRNISNKKFIPNAEYKIQIYYGDIKTAKSKVEEFKRTNNNEYATITFTTPSYKVWVGKYETREDAEKKLKDLKKKYPYSFIIETDKKIGPGKK
jgi:hypothetical protein